jgi:hypothetical protein
VEIVSILLGDPPRIPGAKTEIRLDDERRAYRLALIRGPVTQNLLAATKDLRILESRVVGAPVYDVVYDEFEENPLRAFAHKVTLIAPSTRVTVSVSLSDVEVNAPPDPGLYLLDAPPGAKIIEVDAEGKETPAR